MTRHRQSDLVSNAVSGVTIGTMTSINALSMAAIVFTGVLAPYRATGITLTLVGVALAGVIVNRLSSFRVAFVFPSLISAAILNPVCREVTSDLLARGRSSAVLPTVVATIGASSLGAGLLLIVLGQLKKSRYLRFIPHPIVAGFIASAGVFLIKASVSIATGIDLTVRHAALLTSPDSLLRIGMALAFAVTVMVAQRCTRHYLALPVCCVVGALLPHVYVWAAGADLEALRGANWFLAHYQADLAVRPIFFVAGVDWKVLADHLLSLAPIALVLPLETVLHSSSIEAHLQEQADLDRQLLADGVGMAGAGLFGCLSSKTAQGTTAIAIQAGASNKSAGLFYVASIVFMIVLGDRVIPQVPIYLLAGLGFYFGLRFIKEWLIDTYRRFAIHDFVLVVAMVAVVTTLGFLPGLVLGLIAASVLFVLRYGQLEVVKSCRSGIETGSFIERSREARSVLNDYSDEILVLELQGFLFFGTAYNILDSIHAHRTRGATHPLRFLILDLSRVTGMDASAADTVKKLRTTQLTGENGRIVLVGVSARMRASLRDNALLEDDAVKIFPDLDRGLEWCEDQVLAGRWSEDSSETGLERQLGEFLDPDQFGRFEEFLTRREVARGTRLARHGEPSHCLYFLVEGRLSVYRDVGEDRSLRFRTFTRGTIVGELGLYLGTARSADLIADTDIVVYQLSLSAFADLRHREPRFAMALHEYVVRLLGLRLTTLSRRVEQLMQ